MQPSVFQFSIGRKVYSLQCGPNARSKVEQWSNTLNKMVNINTIKHPSLSDENLLLITAFEILDKIEGHNTEEQDKELNNALQSHLATVRQIKEIALQIKSMLDD